MNIKELYYKIANKFDLFNIYAKLEMHHMRKVIKYMKKLGTWKFSGEDLDGYKFEIIEKEEFK